MFGVGKDRLAFTGFAAVKMRVWLEKVRIVLV